MSERANIEIQDKAEEQQPKSESVEIDSAVFRRLKVIAEVVGGDCGIQVEIGQSGQGSFFNIQEVKITLDPLHIEQNPELAEFVTAHEGGHRAITCGPHEIGLKEEKINQYYSQIGFAYGQNCCEDPADNNWFTTKFEGLKEVTDNVYNKMLKKENIPLGLDNPQVKQAVQTLGYIPRFVYFGSEIIRDWHQNKYSEELDPAVKKSLEQVKDDYQDYFTTIPAKDITPKEKIDKAQQRFMLFSQNIWPEMKKIVELDINDEKLRQMMQNQQDELLKQLKDKLKKELQEKIKQAKKNLNKQKQDIQKQTDQISQQTDKLDKEIEKIKEKAAKAQGKEKDDLAKEIDRKEQQKKDNQNKQQELKEKLENIQDKQDRGDLPLPMDKLSDELKEKLQEIFDNLSDDDKKQLANQAKENLENLEDQLNQDKAGKLNLDKSESHQDRKARQQKEQKQQEQQRQEDKMRKKMEQDIKKKIESQMSEYDKNYEEVKPIIDDLYQELKKIFLPQRHPRWQQGYPSGSRLDLAKAMQFEADKSKHTEIWERKTIPKKIDYSFMLLVDMSSSMDDDNKIQETFKGLIILTETLNRLGIKVAVNGFNTSFKNNVRQYKLFKQDLDKSTRNNLSKILTGTKNYTPTSQATKFSSQELADNKSRNSFLITLTDGQPYIGNQTESEKVKTKQVIQDIRKNTNQKLVGLGLGFDTDFVKDYYPAALGNIEVKQLPKLLADLLQDMIKNPTKY